MALQKHQKEVVVKAFQRSPMDTGSPEVQVALLTYRILELTEHFKIHKQDKHGRLGLIKMVASRRSLLDYLKRTKPDSYTKLIDDLGLRK
jgi:small subunit ribosomal protein S15